MSWSDDGSFVACRDCGVLQPISLAGGANSGQAVAESMEAFGNFVATHGSHWMAPFRRHGSASLSDRPLWDPMANTRFEVTDGQHTYVVSCARSSIEEPRIYRFAPGALELGASEVTIDEAVLRRVLDGEFYPHALRPTKLDRLIAVLHEAVRRLAADELDIAFDVADDPEVSIAHMPDYAFQTLLAAVTEIFDPWEIPRVRRFLHDHRTAAGVLALRVRRHVVTFT